ncbi:tubulin-specific chaperone cofactor E-like protein isoform X2 [Mytilus californianus]|uniref:tubulin-specific chaperone cofactor E-like protein isoform X2 n=1 Tax=Mytilus californianus TaxID=6549 RepID=UPI00224526F3|nr:tubulin-specific chaperone cofactor E-like protein isoform X2 [Mytilus californianus]
MTASTGITMVEAIHQKYDDDVETCIHIHIPASAPGKTDSGHIVIPPILALHDSNICEAGDLDRLGTLCKQVQELDLTKNCIKDWNQIIEIIERLPRLRFLNLTSNPIENRSSWQCDKQFPNISNLILNDTNIAWDCLMKLLHVFPRVEELHLSLNGYSSVDLHGDFRFPPLSRLYLNENKIQDWTEMCRLGQCFPNLGNLVAMESKFTSIMSDADLKETFPCLKSLNLSKTNLATWEDIEIFREFPALVDLRIKDLSFIKKLSEKERRQNIVSRLPNITKLNGSPVHEQEREEAERAFIRNFLDAETKPKRFYELEEIHGKLKHLVDVDLSPDLYYHIKVKYEDKEEMMDILKDQTVKDLKKVLQNFCGLPNNKIKIYEFRSDYNDLNLLRSNIRSLHSYRWTEMDEIHIYHAETYVIPKLHVHIIEGHGLAK